MDTGNTVVVIEHNLEVIKTADWIIDLGPEGGDKGGKVVATGTPEEVAKVKTSYTGQYLQALLKKRPGKKASGKVAVSGKAVKKPPAKKKPGKKQAKAAE